MNGIVIIGHGNFGSGLNSTLELIAGNMILLNMEILHLKNHLKNLKKKLN